VNRPAGKIAACFVAPMMLQKWEAQISLIELHKEYFKKYLNLLGCRCKGFSVAHLRSLLN
jgi:hypothetical protein